MEDARELLESLFDTAIETVQPSRCIPKYLPSPPDGRCVVFGAGKAAASMAAAVEAHWPNEIMGLVVVPYGHAVPCEHIEVIEAAHPVPDSASVAAARRMLDLANGMGAQDLALCLFSGGGSSVLCLPADGISLEKKQKTTQELLRSGAPIAEINAARIEMSRIKGGHLARACEPARVVTLVMSDVPGDDAALVASGPSILPDSTKTSPDQQLVHVITSAHDALDGAWRYARDHGVHAEIIGDALQDEARVMAATHASVARSVIHGSPALPRPCVLLSGGESSVTVQGDGAGGRNSEYLLALAIELDGLGNVWALAADTDGIDGSGDHAGAFLFPDSLARATEKGLDPDKLLANNDSYRFFAGLEDLLITGPTRVNVNDFRAILISR